MSSLPSSASSGRPDLPRVASGQRLVIYAILLNILTATLAVVIGEHSSFLVMFVGLAAWVMGLVGFFMLASGLGYSVLLIILLAILMLIPLINVITLLVLNSRATAVLRAGGYKVGLLGASRVAGAG